MKNRYIIHVDMDAFFAAIEERDRPSLKESRSLSALILKAGKDEA
ncbi:MAG: hypothetical protein Q8O01_01610 [Candidatus Omnitrophota bacterium]|nr:hypothetical protein [Candidatus Omnitrophota bacterium]